MSDRLDEDFELRLPLSRALVDRDHESRSRPGLIEELRADPETLVLILADRRALLADGPATGAGQRPKLEMLRAPEVPAQGFGVYLGRVTDGEHRGRSVIAEIFESTSATGLDVPDERWGDLRLLGADFDSLDAGLFTQALAIANWHATHGFSPRTGMATVTGMGGWVRYPVGHEDEATGEHIFPRTDPAVIVGIVDDEDRILLGANARWGTGRYSVLAGFVEPGESFEAAVEREVFEESGIRVVDPVYLGSQPWPFPASIMVGFTARVAPGTDSTPVPDGVEIVDLRWFRRDELADGVRDVGIPNRSSIARAIIERWYGGRLDAP